MLEPVGVLQRAIVRACVMEGVRSTVLGRVVGLQHATVLGPAMASV